MLGHIPFKYFIYSRSESDTEATFCPLWPNTAGYSRTLWTLANSPLWKYEFSMLENWDSVLRIHPDPGQRTVHIFILIRDSVQYIYSFWSGTVYSTYIHPDPGQCTVHTFILIRDSVQYIYSLWSGTVYSKYIYSFWSGTVYSTYIHSD